MRKLLVILFLSVCLQAFTQLTPGQKTKIDSLQGVIETAKQDTTIINAWLEWDNIIYATDPQLDLELNEKIEALSAKNLRGSLTTSEKKFFLTARGDALNIFGAIHYSHGDYAKAINYFTQSLQILEELEDKRGIAIALSNIGMIYYDQGNLDTAIEYHTRGLLLEEELENKKGIATSHNNLGISYQKRGNYNEAMEHYNYGLKIQEEIGDRRGIAGSFSNIGSIYKTQGNYNKAMDYYLRSLKIKEEIDDFRGITITLTNLGNIYQEQGKYTESINYANQALSIAKDIETPMRIKEASKLLFENYKKLSQYKSALSMYELYIATRDSLDSEENQKEVIRQEYKYEYEKQAATDSVKNAEAQKIKDAQLAAQKAENEQHIIEANQQKQQSYFLYGGLGIALLFGGFIFNRFRVTRAQKHIIEKQKKKVDDAFNELGEKNKESLDSINYAKRIQSAILPPDKVVKEYLQDSFILYKPKDVVAGDFYWMEHIDGKVLFAAADCTGHGVPGAMVSVICNNALNRSTREYGLSDPGLILDKTREIVIQEFAKSEEEVKDGMDIALCSLNGSKLDYAGANNPLWIIRNGEILETKANKQPIGKFDKSSPYNTHSFTLEKGDSIFIFSDGYVDQFGGEKGKKFKSKAFKELLISINEQSMEEQKKVINNTFEKWRGNIEQIDDVCVIGVRI